jgi:internalin A
VLPTSIVAGRPGASKLGLTYLGLRGDRITDAGLRHIGELTSLTGLNLGQTDISDQGLVELKPLVRLK